MDFQGKHKMVAALDAAVALGEERAVTAALRSALVSLFGDREVGLPAQVLQPITDHYARRELHTSPELGYSVVAMTWGPGQGTHIHDHDGAWCVEGVWHGRLAITRYEPLAREGERWRFEAVDELEAAPGSAGSLIPPHEYHAIRNPQADAVAVSLHVYQHPLLRCHVFVPEDGALGACGWTRREERHLCTDPAA
ncbi:cysteine dioxygenase type I [Pseudoxanthomonas suwonensis 11-1]|uniref:Cysteine dioxygenase type I n=2 Tax=Pseudoxanthomonas suwonensis TaxID=314722 RepID=E6WSG1_PSEUU|nr:cysteine dioxygenase family protein [Pseudoxanthomonas suwonensis]ADV27110.1 cysteine dioxygenase type I [Pseudoxanthomonas suwonensis 11-1]